MHRKRIIIFFLILVQAVWLAHAVIPHHHHHDGCLEDAMCLMHSTEHPEAQDFPEHSHHGHGTSPCCELESATPLPTPKASQGSSQTRVDHGTSPGLLSEAGTRTIHLFKVKRVLGVPQCAPLQALAFTSPPCHRGPPCR
ncbi:MAG: hypothetical protein IH599_08195 [Bacteroidales bacterium]|nr:hypothetical protein [Bacteroidales bacterium]